MTTSPALRLLYLSLTLVAHPALCYTITKPVPNSKYTAAQSRPRRVTPRPPAQEDAAREARRLHEQASELARNGKYDEAIALAGRALDEMEAAVGTNDIRYGVTLNGLASLYLHKGDFTRAEQLFKQLVAGAGGMAESDPSLPATARNNLGVTYSHQGKYALAEAELEQARRIRERVLGAEHPEVGVTLTYLGQVQFQRGEYANAERTYERALSLLNNRADDYRLELAILHNSLALLYATTGRLDLAFEWFERSLATHRGLGGEINPEVATVLTNLGPTYKAKGDYANAERVLKEALDILGKFGGASHIDNAVALVNLADVYTATANYGEAEEALLRALEIYRNASGVAPERVAVAKNNLALVYRELGKFAESRALSAEVLAFFEGEFGQGHLKTAAPLNNLAFLSNDTGEHEKARELLRRVIEIYEKSTGVDPSLIATAQQNHATLDLLFEDYAGATRRFEKARELLVKAHGTHHPLVATTLNNQAAVAEAQGDYGNAIKLYEQALDIRRRVLRAGHPAIGVSLNNIGLAHYNNQEYVRAEVLLRQAVKTLEEAGVENHSNFTLTLGNLGLALLARGNTAEALQVMGRWTDLRERQLSRLVSVGSSSQKRLYAESLLTETSGLITIHLNLAPDNREAARLALTTILRRKGRVLDTMIDQAASLRRRLKPQDQALLEKLQAVNGRLSTLGRGEAGAADAAQPREEVARLEAEASRLEAQLSASSAEFRTEMQPVTLEQVRQALPPSAALVEFVWYRPLNTKPKSEADRLGVPRFAAYVLRREGEPGFVDLGQAPLVELLLFRLRTALRDPRREDVKQLARLLDRTLMQPVRRLLGDERRIFISADGTLNLIPFGALVDEGGRYLIERHEFTYLTSGRDLLRGRNHFAARQPPLVIANPSFGPAPGPDKAERPSGAPRIYFAPLNGTEEEAREVAGLLGLVPLTGARATEGSLKVAGGPGILHIATHGYFVPYEEPGAAAEGLNPFRSLSQFKAVEESKSPLLRSGLAFAGANQPALGGGEDGVLTALEAAGLDLWGTKLVVLSACETGLGDVQVGEGVYGLRRSFMLAGAESVVMSFWKVDDEATRGLMGQYYKRLLSGEGRSEALRQVQLRNLGDPARNHPYYWASFIHLGNWQGLDAGGAAPR